MVEQPGLARPEAVLCTKFKAHDAAITALAVLKDEPGEAEAQYPAACILQAAVEGQPRCDTSLFELAAAGTHCD